MRYVEFSPDASASLTCCQRACPVCTDVSAYVALVAQGRFREALAIVREENPFPSTCGRVCDHACEAHCRRAESDQPVGIRALKRFLADHERGGDVDWPERIVPSREQKVAIIGSGPAGLTAATDLLRRGYQVSVFEALPVVGGMMRVGIPDYRLPPDVLDFDLEHIRRLGVEVKLNTALGREFSLADLQADGYEAALLATGTHASRELRVEGVGLPGVSAGIDFVREAKLGDAPDVGKRVVVIGGGDVAMDSARTALRLGAEQVDLFCLESREDMPAHDWETREALDEQIRFHCGWGPTELTGEGRVQRATFTRCTSVFDSSGRFAPTFDASQLTTVDADAVLHAIGQAGEFAHAPEDGVEVTEAQLYRADSSTLQTTAPWVFAAGDAAYGTATVIEAVASGHRAAASIREYLEGRPLTGAWEPVLHADRVERAEVSLDWGELPSAEEPELPADERVRSFAEVKLGLDEGAAVLEASRCMRCDHETDSRTYSRLVREQVYHLARDMGESERERLDFLARKLADSRDRPRVEEHSASLGDLLFLPANLTRLVIDPYREPCNTRTVIGERAAKPLALSGPVAVGGFPLTELAESTLAGLCQVSRDAEMALRVPVGVELPAGGALVIRVAPLEPVPG
ncbi:MAG TPA: FAD-dependent oxidoreductase, partial [Armatimonadota bacterium]|nr:FAD-dependent oxidoreductase [Armatimonadota bacterium]